MILDSTSTWTLTADTYITSFEGDVSNVIGNGYTLYVNGTPLTSAEISLKLDDDGVCRYYENGIFVEKTGVTEIDGVQYLIIDGCLMTDANGFTAFGDQWYLCTAGVIQTQYSGLYCDPDYGWWLVVDGAIDFSYTGLWNDPNYGWWLINGGQICRDYTGLYCDANYGWWLINDGTIAWDYTGLWNDSLCGWWLINDGTIAWDYTGLWNDSLCGTWMIQNGTIDWSYAGS